MQNELRIGNLVLDCDGSIYAIASGSDIDGIWKPIPITEEWLLRFGFEDKEYTMELNGLTFSWFSKVVATGLRSSWSCEQHPHIKYVHQLQNLYFALTGEELKTQSK